VRIGLGYDIHRLAPSETGIILGGVQIPLNRRLVGHSDGDALCHAIIDALLGAANLGDIGQKFPDTDLTYKDISSLELLKRTAAWLRSAGFAVINIDAVVVAEVPRVAPHKEEMARNIAAILGIDPSRVSIKGKTAEGLGAIGAGEALCVHAVALVEEEK